jgi:phage tail tape-measure protein
MKRDAQPSTNWIFTAAEFRKVRAQAARSAERLARICQDPAATLGQLSRAIQAASMSTNVLGVHVESTRCRSPSGERCATRTRTEESARSSSALLGRASLLPAALPAERSGRQSRA